MHLIFKKNFVGILIFILSYISLFFSFYLNEDGTGMGASGDFHLTYSYVIALQDNLLTDPMDHSLVHMPLHFIILSLLSYIIDSPYYLRLFYCMLSFLTPLFFYKCLKLKFNTINNNTALLIASSVFFLPAFRYTSIWATDLTTSIFFFTVSIYFYLKWTATNKRNLCVDIFYQLFFLALSTYCRQYFAIFFIYFLTIYYQNLSKREFLLLFLFCILTSFPVLLFVYLFPELITGQHISIKAIPYFLLGNTSIISVYLFPIFVFYIMDDFKKILFIKNFKNLLISIFIVFCISFFFKPDLVIWESNTWLGGGIIYSLSMNLFNNNYIFLVSSIFTIFVLYNFIIEKKINLIIILITIFIFFSFQVYQRYYEPMFLIILFFLIETKQVKFFVSKANSAVFLYIFFVIYYLGSVSEIIYKF